MLNKKSQLVDIGKIQIKEENFVFDDNENNYVSIKIKANGICGSDLHYFKEGGLGTHKIKFPLTMGHEPSGEIIKSNSKLFQKGERVAIEPNLPCIHFKNTLNCEPCNGGLHNLCPSSKFLGSVSSEGAFQEYLNVHISQLIKIDDQTSYEEATLLEPLSVALHAFNKIKFQMGMRICIIGSGPIGLCLGLVAKLMGAPEILFIDKLNYRLQLANEITGCDFVNENQNDDTLKKYKNYFDVVFDAAGKPQTFLNSLSLAKLGGIVNLVGIPTYDFLSYNPHVARLKELTILNCRRSNQFLKIAYEAFKKNNLPLKKIITHKYKLVDIQKAFETNINYEDDVIKSIIYND